MKELRKLKEANSLLMAERKQKMQWNEKAMQLIRLNGIGYQLEDVAGKFWEDAPRPIDIDFRGSAGTDAKELDRIKKIADLVRNRVVKKIQEEAEEHLMKVVYMELNKPDVRNAIKKSGEKAGEMVEDTVLLSIARMAAGAFRKGLRSYE